MPITRKHWQCFSKSQDGFGNTCPSDLEILHPSTSSPEILGPRGMYFLTNPSCEQCMDTFDIDLKRFCTFWVILLIRSRALLRIERGGCFAYLRDFYQTSSNCPAWKGALYFSAKYLSNISTKFWQEMILQNISKEVEVEDSEQVPCRCSALSIHLQFPSKWFAKI